MVVVAVVHERVHEGRIEVVVGIRNLCTSGHTQPVHIRAMMLGEGGIDVGEVEHR